MTSIINNNIFIDIFNNNYDIKYSIEKLKEYNLYNNNFDNTFLVYQYFTNIIRIESIDEINFLTSNLIKNIFEDKNNYKDLYLKFFLLLIHIKNIDSVDSNIIFYHIIHELYKIFTEVTILFLIYFTPNTGSFIFIKDLINYCKIIDNETGENTLDIFKLEIEMMKIFWFEFETNDKKFKNKNLEGIFNYKKNLLKNFASNSQTKNYIFSQLLFTDISNEELFKLHRFMLICFTDNSIKNYEFNSYYCNKFIENENKNEK